MWFRKESMFQVKVAFCLKLFPSREQSQWCVKDGEAFFVVMKAKLLSASGFTSWLLSLILWSEFTEKEVHTRTHTLKRPSHTKACRFRVMRCSTVIKRQSFWLLWPMGVGQRSTHNAARLSVKRPMYIKAEAIPRKAACFVIAKCHRPWKIGLSVSVP